MALFPHSGCSKLHTLELFTPAKFKLRHYPKTALRTVTLEELPGLQVDRHGRLHGAAPTHAAPEVYPLKHRDGFAGSPRGAALPADYITRPLEHREGREWGGWCHRAWQERSRREP